MIRPCEEESDLQNMSAGNGHGIKPEFMEQIEELKVFIFNRIQPMRVGQAGEGKMAGMTMLRFDSGEKAKAYMKAWRHSTGHNKGKSCQMGATTTLSMDRLGGRKPSELLAAMMEFCPAGHESSPFLAFFFLHRLPRELRCLLSDADMSDLRLLAEKANRLAALHSHHDFDAVAAVDGGSSDSDEDAVVAAAMRSKQPAKKKAAANKSGGKDSKSGGKDSKSGGSSLCYFHLKFGDKAYKCVSRKCSWPEN